jgi:hypothetical protein
VNATVPGLAIDLVESLKKNSPPLTWTMVVFACADPNGAIARIAIATASVVTSFIAVSYESE